MTPGHFGLAAGAKKWAPQLPLWALFVSTYLLDIMFLLFWILGLEGLSPLDPGHPNAYGGVLIHADYTHSLLGAGLIAALAGRLAARRWGARSGFMLAGVTFSHWILDLIVHRPDLPVLPGNFGNLPQLGFGLWEYPLVSASIELVLVIGGAILYLQSSIRRAASKRRAVAASLVTGSLLVLLFITNTLGV